MLPARYDDDDEFLANPRSTVLAKGGDASLYPTVYRILIIDCIAVSEQYVVELSGLPYFCGNIVNPIGFPIFNFSKNRVVFFLSD